LEVEEPELYFDDFIKAGSNIITFHPQVNVKSERALRYLKAKKIQTSIAIDLDIKIDKIIQFISLIDFIIIMSVYPGFGNQEYRDESSQKIKMLKKIIIESNYNTRIMIDGGVKREIEEELINYGADILIYGSSLF
jgi:ribulose-phosphate 3-epimerase